MLTVEVSGIDLNNRELKYYSPKRKIYRQVAFHEDLVEIPKHRIEKVNDGKLFEYDNIENLGKACNRYFKQIGIAGKDYSARTFRKTFIKSMPMRL